MAFDRDRPGTSAETGNSVSGGARVGGGASDDIARSSDVGTDSGGFAGGIGPRDYTDPSQSNITGNTNGLADMETGEDVNRMINDDSLTLGGDIGEGDFGRG